MDAAVASLLGAVAGGSATFVGTVITNVSQSRRDDRKVQQTQKAEAYGNALRNLLLVLHLRSGLTSPGESIIKLEQVPDRFAAVVEAEYWVTILTAVCGSAYRQRLVAASDELAGVIGRLLEEPGMPPATEGSFWHVYTTVSTAARADLADVN